MMQTYAEFYQSVNLPAFAPPGWLFGVAWGIIYPLMAIAGGYLLYLTVKKQVPVYLIILFALNLAANLLFTPIQLGLTALWPASFDILIILATLAVLEYKVWRYSKIIFLLLVPYLLWGAFATVLQLTITVTNPQAASVVAYHDLIRIEVPVAGQAIQSPLVIKGEARGNWFFEASFPVFLTNWDGLIIAQGIATAQGEWMTADFVPFEATLNFTVEEEIYSRRGTLILQKDNPSGLPEHDDALEIPVVFVEATGATINQPLPPEPVFCTMDAKACPDGSYVGRTGPRCEFSACPTIK